MIFARDDSQLDQLSPYGYVPTLSICILFVVLFSLTSRKFQPFPFEKRVLRCTQLCIACRRYTRHWFILPTIVLAGALEVLGWSARLWSSKNVLANTPFTIQIGVLIIAPTPLLGAHFIVFGRIVSILGTQYSRFAPALYAKIFLSCDIISLIVQAIGGGWASSASNQPNGNIQPGTDLMLAGIGFQLGVIVMFSTLFIEFLFRYLHDRPVRVIDVSHRGVLDGRRKLALFSVAFATMCLFVRAIYRMVELSTGWGGTVMDTQWLFCFLEAGMVVLAFYTWNFLHPGWTLALPAGYKADGEMSSSGSGETLSYPVREANHARF